MFFSCFSFCFCEDFWLGIGLVLTSFIYFFYNLITNHEIDLKFDQSISFICTTFGIFAAFFSNLQLINKIAEWPIYSDSTSTGSNL